VGSEMCIRDRNIVDLLKIISDKVDRIRGKN